MFSSATHVHVAIYMHVHVNLLCSIQAEVPQGRESGGLLPRGCGGLEGWGQMLTLWCGYHGLALRSGCPSPFPSMGLSLRGRSRRMSSTWLRYGGRAAGKTLSTHSHLLCQLAREFWGPNITPAQRNKANSALVEGIYQTLKKTKSVQTTCLVCRRVLIVAMAPSSSFAYRPIMGLEYSQYLENYLWPNFDPDKVPSCVSL